MQGRKELCPKILYQLSIEDLVPEDNFYRKLLGAINLDFLYEATAKYYGKEGQASIDPVVFFKICLVGYLNNIPSDRKLISYCNNCLDVRWYLRYDIDEALPWHSTISRTRQLYGEEVFLMLFQKVLSLCVEAGMVRGKRQCIDSAYIKANASMDSLQEKPTLNDIEAEVLADVAKYAEELNEGSDYQLRLTKTREEEVKEVKEAKEVKERHDGCEPKACKGMPARVAGLKQVDENGHLIRSKHLSNQTHYSPTDPDAKISTKPGKPRQLNYAAQISVDDKHHVITGACASSAANKDSQNLPEILGQTLSNLAVQGIKIEEVVADAGYSSGEALAYCQAHNIEAYIPNLGQYKPERKGFVYNKEKDQYECQRGHKAILFFKKTATDSKGYTKRIYRSHNSSCRDCPLRKACIGKSYYKKIEDSVDKPYYDRMHEKLTRNRAYAKKLSRIRSKTVEPVLGILINFLNLRRVNTRGKSKATKHVLLSALSYNLKKYINFIHKTREVISNAQVMLEQQAGWVVRENFFIQPPIRLWAML